MEILIVAGVFLSTLLLIYAGYFIARKVYRPEMRKTRRRLRMLSIAGHPTKAIDIMKKRTVTEIPWLNRLLLDIPPIARLEEFLAQADTPHPLGVFMLLSALLFLAGLLLGMVLGINLFVMAAASMLPAAIPFLYLFWKRQKRREKFEKQLPEVIELLARSLKAGHALTGGIKMISEEFADPAGAEFGALLDEINFGVGLPQALADMTNRVESDDLKFFAVSIIIQRETGGNLVEILENLSRLIRERFKFRGRVRALSAEGRLSAVVLVAIPFCVAAFLSLFRPEYIGILLSDAIGHALVATALVMMVLGIYVMKKMVSIKA